MHTSSAISYSFQGNSPQKFPNLETSLGTPPPVAHQAPRGWGQKSLLCHCGSWYHLQSPPLTPATVLSGSHLTLYIAAKIIFWKKKINLVLSVCFKTSLDFILPTE